MLSEEEILEQLEQKKIPLKAPFGCHTPKYMPVADMESLKSIMEKFYNISHQHHHEEKKSLLNEIFEIRKKNRSIYLCNY